MHNAWVAFLERYRLYEKAKRIAPTFRELVNDLNCRQLFGEAPQMSDELKSIYGVLSDYVHPSSSKFENAIGKKAEINPSFSPKEFDIVLELGKRVLDAVQFLYVVTIAHFYGFETGRSFLQDIAKRTSISVLGKEPKKNLDFLSLPFSRRLSEGSALQEKARRKNT
jgi:hypothetical protein